MEEKRRKRLILRTKAVTWPLMDGFQNHMSEKLNFVYMHLIPCHNAMTIHLCTRPSPCCLEYLWPQFRTRLYICGDLKMICYLGNSIRYWCRTYLLYEQYDVCMKLNMLMQDLPALQTVWIPTEREDGFHLTQRCLYLFPDSRPTSWKPNKKIQRIVDKNLKRD